MSGAACSPRPGSSRTSTDPTRGTAISSVSRYSVITTSLERGGLAVAPDVVAEHEHDAQHQRRGVGLDRPGLQPPQPRGADLHDPAGAVDGAVDHPGVD